VNRFAHLLWQPYGLLVDVLTSRQRKVRLFLFFGSSVVRQNELELTERAQNCTRH
jgi:hypothetical protein